MAQIACAPGKFAANAQSTACTLCAANTYSALPAASVCQSCEVGYVSAPGSARCVVWSNETHLQQLAVADPRGVVLQPPFSPAQMLYTLAVPAAQNAATAAAQLLSLSAASVSGIATLQYSVRGTLMATCAENGVPCIFDSMLPLAPAAALPPAAAVLHTITVLANSGDLREYTVALRARDTRSALTAIVCNGAMLAAASSSSGASVALEPAIIITRDVPFLNVSGRCVSPACSVVVLLHSAAAAVTATVDAVSGAFFAAVPLAAIAAAGHDEEAVIQSAAEDARYTSNYTIVVERVDSPQAAIADESASTMSTGASVGIAVGGVVVVSLLVLVLCLLLRFIRRRKDARAREEPIAAQREGAAAAATNVNGSASTTEGPEANGLIAMHLKFVDTSEGAAVDERKQLKPLDNRLRSSSQSSIELQLVESLRSPSVHAAIEKAQALQQQQRSEARASASAVRVNSPAIDAEGVAETDRGIEGEPAMGDASSHLSAAAIITAGPRPGALAHQVHEELASTAELDPEAVPLQLQLQ
jgi:hypothetical protein